jgi:DNA helicase-2/ATP-dependent DNA helicase PcrA
LARNSLTAADIQQLERIAAGYKSRQRFLTDLTLDPPEATTGKSKASLPEEDDYLVLSTIHSAKGGEWRMVRILSVVEGCIPSSKATTADEIEEERRLLYVAMTRAKLDLDLIVPIRSYVHRQTNGSGEYCYGVESRFLPRSIHKFFDKRNWQQRRISAPAKANARKGTLVNVTDELVRFWR